MKIRMAPVGMNNGRRRQRPYLCGASSFLGSCGMHNFTLFMGIGAKVDAIRSCVRTKTRSEIPAYAKLAVPSWQSLEPPTDGKRDER